MITRAHHEPFWRPSDRLHAASEPGRLADPRWPLSESEPAGRPHGDPSSTDPPVPLGFGEVFSISVRVLGDRWRSLYGMALVVVLPFVLLALIAALNYNATWNGVYGGLSGFFVTDEEVGRVGMAEVAVYVTGVVETIALLVAGLGIASIVAGDRSGQAVSVREAVGSCRRRALRAIAASILLGLMVIGLAIAAIIVFVIGSFVAAAFDDGAVSAIIAIASIALAISIVVVPFVRWSVLMPAMAIEDTGATASLGRSWELTRGHWWRTFAITGLASILAVVLAAVVTSLLSTFVSEVVAEPFSLDAFAVDAIATALGSMILVPLFPVVLAVLYFDLAAREASPRQAPSGPTWGAR